MTKEFGGVAGASKLWFVIPVVLGLPLVHARTLQNILLGSDPPWFRRKKKWVLLALAMAVLVAADQGASVYAASLHGKIVELLTPGVFEPWVLRSLRQEWMTITASQILLLGMALMFTSCPDSSLVDGVNSGVHASPSDSGPGGRPSYKAKSSLPSEIPHSRVVNVSSFYRTPPLGPQDQPDYLNAAVALAMPSDFAEPPPTPPKRQVTWRALSRAKAAWLRRSSMPMSPSTC